MFRGDLGVWLSVVSSGRPHNVERMARHIGAATWIVQPHEVNVYVDAQAPVVVGVPGVAGRNLCQARNEALEAAFGAGYPCVQIDDDLKKLQVAALDANQKVLVETVTFHQVVRHLAAACKETGARLAGIAPTPNPFYYRGRPVNTAGFVIGSLLYVQPCILRFDTTLALKEDYDYTLQHLKQYGRVARCDDLLLTFEHYKNAGGVVSYRSSGVEQTAIAHLKKKWPGMIRDNPRRPNEILLATRSPRKGAG